MPLFSQDRVHAINRENHALALVFSQGEFAARFRDGKNS